MTTTDQIAALIREREGWPYKRVPVPEKAVDIHARDLAERLERAKEAKRS